MPILLIAGLGLAGTGVIAGTSYSVNKLANAGFKIGAVYLGYLIATGKVKLS